jgi:hypothetical protein
VDTEDVQFLNKVIPLAVEVAKPDPEFKRVMLEVGETFTVIDIEDIEVVPLVLLMNNVAVVFPTVLYTIVCGPVPVALAGVPEVKSHA